MPIRVLQVGLGPIGASIARRVGERAGFELAGGVDLGPVCGLGREIGVAVSSDL